MSPLSFAWLSDYRRNAIQVLFVPLRARGRMLTEILHLTELPFIRCILEPKFSTALFSLAKPQS
jgi:hypothetical protein